MSRKRSRESEGRAAALLVLLTAVGAGCGGAAPAGAVARPERGAAASLAGPAAAPAAGEGLLELVRRLPGEARNGELGFRFGPPRDVDGDGVADIAAGARFTNLEWTGMGTAAVWSSADGRQLAYWEGHAQDALFGHSVLIGPDVDGDRHPDVVAAAPNGKYFDVYRGLLYARSAFTGRLLWSVAGEPGEALGWHLALAGDQNGDGVLDLFAGVPGGGIVGKVYLLSGRDGSTIRVFASESKDTDDQFGWYVSAVGDLDGDGRDDLVVGEPSAASEGGGRAGAAFVFSTASGRRLHAWFGRRRNDQFGEVVAGLPDLDGDGAAEVGVAAPSRLLSIEEEPRPGEVTIYSGASGAVLRRWSGTQTGELYGRMLASAGDADGDGAGDIAIGAPWYGAAGAEKAGRFELRSGRTGEVLAAVAGERKEMWLGWHIEAGEDLGPGRRRGLVVSTLRSTENGLEGAGALLIYLYARRGSK